MQLDTQSQATLDEISAKELEALTPEDIGFLRARRSYLNSEQHNKFASVLADEQDQPAVVPASEAENAEDAAPLAAQQEDKPKRGRRAAQQED